MRTIERTFVIVCLFALLTLAAICTESVASSGPQLELVEWHWGPSESGITVKAEGEVTNISNEPLRNVVALVSFYTKDRTFITSDTGFLEYNPILPGQTSPFRVITGYNRAMAMASIDFKYFGGGSIFWRKKK
jgi:hypothetical protein